MYLEKWRGEMWSGTLFVVGLSISITSSYIGLVHSESVQGHYNHTHLQQYHFNYSTGNNSSNHRNVTPTRINACGTRLKLEIKSICASQKNFPVIKQTEEEGLSERRPHILERK